MSPKRNINLKANHGILGDSWIAGTNSKTLCSIFKHKNLETIDIKAICETISYDIRMLRKETENSEGNLWHCMRFRVLSHLCFGTIRIYNQQVQNLLVQTRRFFERSYFKKAKIISQRCTHLYIANRNFRVHQNGGTFVATNTKLNEAEHENQKEKRRSRKRESNFSMMENVPTISKKSLTGMHSFQINAFTIREVNIDSGVPELEEHLDFGDTALEQTAVLVNDLFGSNTQIKEDEIDNKKSKEKCLSNGKNSFKVDQSPIQYLQSNDSSHVKMCAYGSTGFGKPNHLNHLLVDTEDQSSRVEKQFSTTKSNDSVRSAKEMHFILERLNYQRTNHYRKILTFDEVVKLSDKELRCSWDQYEEKQCLSRHEIKVVPNNNYGKGLKLELVPNRKCAIKFNCIKTRKYSQAKLSSDHVNIINEIVGNSIDEQQSAELTIKCGDTFLPSPKRRKRKSTNIFIHTTEENTEFEYGKRVCLNNNQIFWAEKSNDKRMSLGYSIMIRLLNILQESRVEYIDAKMFIFNAINRKDAALTFHALLELTNTKCVVMTKDEKTSQIEKIFLGPSFEKMIGK